MSPIDRYPALRSRVPDRYALAFSLALIVVQGILIAWATMEVGQ